MRSRPFAESIPRREREGQEERRNEMPKTRLDKYGKTAKPETPPLDMAWAVVLVRKEQMGLDLKKIAEATGISYEYVRKVFASGSPTKWPVETRDKILAVMGLRARLVIEVDEG